MHIVNHTIVVKGLNYETNTRLDSVYLHNPRLTKGGCCNPLRVFPRSL